MTLRRTVGIASMLVALHSSALAQRLPQKGYMERLADAEKAAAQLPESAFANEDFNKVGPAAMLLDTLGIMQSFTGDVEGAVATFDRMRRLRRTPVNRDAARQISLAGDATAEDAIKAIVEQARTRRVVLLNEAHHVPLHRAFAQKLAAELRKIGYDYLACENFGIRSGAVPLGSNGEVIRATGYYSQDPVFAGFVHSALADKWKLVPYEYEVQSKSTDDRERGQAQNLIDRIFAKDKNAKVFIYVGYGHLNKNTNSERGQFVSMAAYLERMTGLDMLHVEQTVFYPHPDRGEESGLYQPLLDKFPSHEPFVLRSPGGSHPVLLGMKGIVDMQVIFPRYRTIDGRPEWLQTLAGREPRSIPPDLLPAQGRRLVKAQRRDAPPDAIPADMVIVEAGKPVPKLMLPKGEFNYATEDEAPANRGQSM